jgi:signal transduction histidine kinase
MPVSEKLALEIYTIELFHIIAILLAISFTYYLYLKTKKTALFFSYAAVISMLLIWMISKLFKTISPNIHLRWFFIVSQYFGVLFTGLSVIIFAFLMAKGQLLRKRTILLLAVPPFIGFIIVVTNPYHMLFYSYYDFYKDNFGLLFYPISVIVYLYLLIGILILARKFTHQPQFKNNELLARIFAIVVLIPIIGNLYYLLVKLTNVPFVFPFPFFDFTPITSVIALMLFILPAYKYRFLDLLPMAHRHIYDNIPDGIVFLKNEKWLFGYNRSFQLMFNIALPQMSIDTFIKTLAFDSDKEIRAFRDFITSDGNEKEKYILNLRDGLSYKVYFGRTSKNQTLIRFTNISNQVHLKEQLEYRYIELAKKNKKLETLADNVRDLAVTRAHTMIARDVHDILGHSMTVVIGLTDLASMDTDKEKALKRMNQVKELLVNSISDLKSTVEGRQGNPHHTSLIKAIHSLNNDNIKLDLSVQGKPIELTSIQTEVIFRICQESITNAIKHGKANSILINLRFKEREIELYIIDDGIGCKSIIKGYGLKGMSTRINELNGIITIGSDGEKGFNIHIKIPIHE